MELRRRLREKKARLKAEQDACENNKQNKKTTDTNSEQGNEPEFVRTELIDDFSL